MRPQHAEKKTDLKKKMDLKKKNRGKKAIPTTIKSAFREFQNLVFWPISIKHNL